ncbi:MAG: right-handed parallel beta-helix repeat-containing protein, partial [Candidatus Hodarchaeales archaeon]
MKEKIMIILLSISLIMFIKGVDAFPDSTESKTGSLSPLKTQDRDTMSLISKSSSITYMNLDFTIKIINDTEFETKYSFPGDGSISTPYLIQGYNISNSSYHLIDISNTTKFFEIKNNLLNGLNGGKSGIFLEDVANGTIEKNTIINNLNGIFGELLNNVTFYNNTIYNNTNNGLYVLSSSQNNNISNNTIFNNDWNGIKIEASSNYLNNNSVFNNTYSGILLDSNSKFNTLLKNTIYNNTFHGFELYESHNNTFSNNRIFKNKQDGFRVRASQNNTMVNNTVYENSEYGIYLYKHP